MSALLVIPSGKVLVPLGFVPVSCGPQVQTTALAAGVHKDGNPGQCVLWSTVIFVQLRF